MFWSSAPKEELPPFEEREIPENLPLSDEEKQVLAECFKICENKDTEEFLGQYDPYFFTRIVRGYKDYKPRVGETAKAMDKIVCACREWDCSALSELWSCLVPTKKLNRTQLPLSPSTRKLAARQYKWRKENDIDNILKIELKNAQRFNKDLWPCTYHGEDRMGHLVMSEILEQVRVLSRAEVKG